MISTALLLLGVAILTTVLTGAVRAYVLRRGIVDVANERSSHTGVVPRGGGLAIATVLLAGVGLGASAGWVAPALAIALLGGGTAIAVAGWLDDRFRLSARLRFGVHLTAAVWAVAWIGSVRALDLGGVVVPFGVAGPVLTVVGLVWATNLFNFMDGSDGLAGGEAMIAAAGGAALLGHPDGGVAFICVLITGASAGFLVWNWPRARVFMGDVGSGMLGFVFGVLAVAADAGRALPLPLWVLLLGVFVFDATVTLVRRILRGEPFHAAHRNHAYQRLIAAGWSHVRVSLVVFALDVALFALAALGREHRLRLPAVAGGLLLLLAGYLAVERLRPMWPKDPGARGAGQRSAAGHGPATACMSEGGVMAGDSATLDLAG